ncbi:MAG: zf-HC2 domain-containing protein [Acidimicrobiales bacterium]
MSEDDVRASGCDPFTDDLAELALGVLTGRERAQALSHVESCPRCAEELEQLSRVADTVVQAAPDVDPPMGFEVRLFERMGVADVRPHRQRLRPSVWVPAVAAVAAAALALGLGLSLSSSPAPTVAAQHAKGTVSASLLENGETVGHVVAFGGAHPWISMMLADSTAKGTVQCIVVTDDGTTHHVGTFVARQGYGAWIAPLHVKPGDVRTAEVVSPSGTVIATATLG